jgi:hypothetical protein
VVDVLPHVIPSAPASVQDNTSITDGANTLLYQGDIGSPQATWHLVDRHISGIPPDGRMLAGVRTTPS